MPLELESIMKLTPNNASYILGCDDTGGCKIMVDMGDIDNPESKVHGANMGPIWGRQNPGGPYVGPMNFAIWGVHKPKQIRVYSLFQIWYLCCCAN